MSHRLRRFSITLACVLFLVFMAVVGNANAHAAKIEYVGADMANILTSYRAPGRIYTEKTVNGRPGALVKCGTKYGTLSISDGKLYIGTTFTPEYLVSTTAVYVDPKGLVQPVAVNLQTPYEPVSAYRPLDTHPVPMVIHENGVKMTLDSFTAGLQVPGLPALYQ
jgi:hypothetical protein